MRKMRIAIFSDSFYPLINGVSISIDILVKELRNQGHSVYIFAPRIGNEIDADPNVYRFRTLRMPWAKGVPVAFPPYLRMLRKFRRHTFDIIHLHTIGTVSFVGLRWAQSHEIPVVATYHTLYDRYAHYFPVLPKRYVRFKIAKHTNYVYNHVDHVFTPSETSLKWLRRHSVTTKATILPTGIRTALLEDRAESRAKLEVPPNCVMMLFVGRLAKEKNMEVLLQSSAIAMNVNPLLRLWVVGDGPHRSDCQTLARKLGIGDKVNFVGFVERHKVDRYYDAADMFVFASMTETQGLVVQEAMTYGLPSVVVDAGGASAEIVHRENGLLVRNDPQEFANAILELTDDESLMAKIGENARKSSRGYSPEMMVNKILEVYESTIHRQSNHQSNAQTMVTKEG